MTTTELLKKAVEALGFGKRRAVMIGPDVDMNGRAATDGPRAYVHTVPGMYAPLTTTMSGLALSVDEVMADSILTEIERRIAAIEKDRTEFIEARRAQALQEHLKSHHPRIIKEFERVSVVKKSLRRTLR